MKAFSICGRWLGILVFAAIAANDADAIANARNSHTSNVRPAARLQPPETPRPRGIPHDWSHHHLIFSRPLTPAMARRFELNPRYRMQQAWRHRQAMTGSAEEYMQALDAMAVQLAAKGNQPPQTNGKKVKPGPSGPLVGDWSVTLGSSAKVGAGRYPAKYSFSVNGTPDCTNDFVVYNTDVVGSSGQASIIAFNKLYSGSTASSGCGTSGVPAVDWAYNSRGSVIAASVAVNNSVVLSADGTQVAFIHNPTGSGAARLVILKWKAGQGTSATSPASPDNIYVGSANAGSFATCKSTSSSCELELTFSNSVTDSNSSPFYDYTNDIIYVGDDSGLIHKFTTVFTGTPAEVSNSSWPATVFSGATLTSPVLDNGVPASPELYVAYANGQGVFGYLAYTNPTGSGILSFTKSAILGHDTGVDITDAPVVDSSSGNVYVVAGRDGSATPSGGVFVLSRGFAGGASGTEAKIGTATSSSGGLAVYDGNFDNTYYNSSNATGNLYVCGNAGGNPTLYQVPINAGVPGIVRAGPAVGTANTTCSPVTEIFNPNASGGFEDWTFLSVPATGSPSGCGGAGCVVSFNVTAWFASTAYAANQQLLDTNLNIEQVTSAGTSGSSQPSWPAATRGTVTDGTVTWTNEGPLPLPAWQASIAYTAGQEILDKNSNMERATTAGTSGSSQPTWNTTSGGATTDNTVTWTNEGPFTIISPFLPSWQASTAYSSGKTIIDSNNNLQRVTTAGTSGSSQPSWKTSSGGTTTDNTVTWTNEGPLAITARSESGGTSGIIVDNVSNLAGSSQVYFSTLTNSACAGSGSVGCAVQASQSGLQ